MEDFQRGYAFGIEQAAALGAGMTGDEYIQCVDEAIQELYERMNAYDYYRATKPAQDSLKGFIAEEWAAGTADVDAAAKGLPDVVKVFDGDRIKLGSPDVGVSGGPLYQLKTYSNSAETVKALGTTLGERYKNVKASTQMSFGDWAAANGFPGREPTDLLYDGQMNLVAEDKLAECKMDAFKRLAKAKALGKTAEVARWQKVSDGLTDRIMLEDGVESTPLTIESARQKAVDVSGGRTLRPEDDGMTLAEQVKLNNVVSQALKAGVTAAAISAALKVAPEIYKAIDYLISEGELDEDQLKAIGAATLDGGTTGFITGSATAAITIAAQKGILGETIKAAAGKTLGPGVIAVLVVLTIETCKDAYAVARGRLSADELVVNLSRGVFVSVFALVGTAIAAIIVPESAMAMLIGSFVGSAVGAFAYSPVQSCVLKISAASGISFFGLIGQDYQLPKSLLEKLGVREAHYKIAEYESVPTHELNLSTANVKSISVHALDIAFVDRDIVGLRKVGYVLR